MADTWLQRHNRALNRKKQKTQGLEGAPYMGVIQGGGSSSSDRAVVTYHGNSRQVRTNNPYVGRFSWIRTQPEDGTQVIMAERFDAKEPEILAYYQRFPENRIEAYNQGIDLYRPLSPGEIDIASVGFAQTHYGRRAIKEDRAGLVRSWLNQDLLESGSKAAVHRRALHRNLAGGINDEERFGAVRRYVDGSTFKEEFIESDRVSGQQAVNQTAGLASGPFAREYLRILGSGADVPVNLVEIQEGDVVDSDGVVISGTETGLPLRMLRKYYTELGSAHTTELDNKGNVLISTPQEAEIGYTVNIPGGALNVSVGKEIAWIGQDNWSASVTKSFNWLPQERFNIGAARDENAVLGQQLKAFLDQLANILKTWIGVGFAGAPVTVSPATQAQIDLLMQQFVASDKILSDFIYLSKAP